MEDFEVFLSTFRKRVCHCCHGVVDRDGETQWLKAAQILIPHPILIDGLDAWAEMGWPGKTLRLGETELEIVEPIVRCMATTANPETGQRDVDTLAILNGNWEHQDFGIYAEVTQGGRVALGDTLVVI